jgi:hypothetical protein
MDSQWRFNSALLSNIPSSAMKAIIGSTAYRDSCASQAWLTDAGSWQ